VPIRDRGCTGDRRSTSVSIGSSQSVSNTFYIKGMNVGGANVNGPQASPSTAMTGSCSRSTNVAAHGKAAVKGHVGPRVELSKKRLASPQKLLGSGSGQNFPAKIWTAGKPDEYQARNFRAGASPPLGKGFQGAWPADLKIQNTSGVIPGADSPNQRAHEPVK